MSAVGALWLSDPIRFHEVRGDRSAVRAYVKAGSDGVVEEKLESTDDFIVDHVPGIWLTNIAGFALNTSGYGRRQDLKPDNFLGTRVSSLLSELGLDDAGAEEQARAIAGVFRRVLALSADTLGTESFPLEETLSHAIRKRYFKPPRTIDLMPEVKYALQSATQATTFAGGGPKPAEARMFSLRQHRQEYAQRLMDVQVPFGEWSELPVPRDPERAVTWARDLLETRPLLLKVEVNFHGERAHDLAQLTNMGSGAAAVMGERGRAANLREWVAGPEFLALSRLAHVRIRSVLAADRYLANPWSAFAADATEVGSASARVVHRCGPLRLRGLQLADYATGLLAEACAFALSAARDPDPVGAWVTSHDRACGLLAAADLLRAAPDSAVHVSGYTRGRVWIKIPSIDADAEDIFTRVAELCAATRLIPPLMPRPGQKRAEIGYQVSQAAVESGEADVGLFTLAKAILGHHATRSTGVATAC